MRTKKVKQYLWSLKRADDEFSKYIRERDKRCMRCKRVEDFKKLTCSHFWVRQHKGTRFDPENCIALCWPCHAFHFEKEKQGAYRDYMIRWLGQEKYDQLAKKASNTYPQSRAIIDCMTMLGSL